MAIEERFDRMERFSGELGLALPHPLMSQWKIPNDLFSLLSTSVALYVARAMHLSAVPLVDSDVSDLRVDAVDLRNVTPNGAIVPKTEYQIEYNLVLQHWSTICRVMFSNSPHLVTKFRTTPNIRIKFGTEQMSNVGRPLNTATPHSDAWVEGPWGFNCFVPIIGDVDKNTLLYYESENFDEEFITPSESYLSKQWVLDNYAPIPNLRAQVGYVNITDFALIHRTEMPEGCGTRISIDTTIHAGNHDVLPTRSAEYVSVIPEYGTKALVLCHRSERDKFESEKSAFEHYTKGSLETIQIG